MSDMPPITGERHVQSFTLQGRVFFVSVDGYLQGPQGTFNFEFDFVGDAAEFGPLFFRKASEVLQFECKKAGFARKVSSANVL